MHKLENKDLANLTAICQRCGPVEIRKRSDKNAYRCINAHKDRGSIPRWKYHHSDGTVTTLNKEQRDEVMSRFGDCCEICGTQGDLFLDHDHDTKEFRGVLCRDCNAGIGLLKDSYELMLRAAAYLGPHIA